MDSAALKVLKHRLLHFLVAVDAALAAADRQCADCHRRPKNLTLCDDGQWRGPTCRKRHEAGAGVQLPIEGDARG